METTPPRHTGCPSGPCRQLFNRTWELLESPRAAADDRTMLACALASRLHWTGIGTDENSRRVTGWSPMSRATSATPTSPSISPRRPMRRALAAEPPVPTWLVASTQEGLARAHAVRRARRRA